MNTEPLDIRDTLKAKSDQLNADDLAGIEIVVQITGVSRGNSEQPVAVAITGGHKPWMPCKTMRRVLSLAWGGEDANLWVGKWLKLYRDDRVTFGKDTVGGVRLRAMSDIPRPIDVSLAAAKGGKKGIHKIDVLKAPSEGRERSSTPTTSPLDTFRAGVIAAGFAVEGVVDWLGAQGCDTGALNAAEVAMILKDITGPRRGELERHLASQRK
jgi:hypothetical protein